MENRKMYVLLAGLFILISAFFISTSTAFVALLLGFLFVPPVLMVVAALAQGISILSKIVLDDENEEVTITV